MADQSEAMGWIGKTVVDRDGGEVGPCTTVLFDDAGRPEWLGVDHAGVRRKLPADGATTENGKVRVDLDRGQVMEAPRLTATTPTQSHHSGAGRDRQVMGGLGAVAALVVAFVALRWLKARRRPSQSERLLGAARETAGRASRGGASMLDRTVAAAGPAAVAAGRAASKEGKRARAIAAKEGKRARAVAMKEGKRARSVATEEGRRAGKAAAEHAQRAGKVAAEQTHRAGKVAAEQAHRAGGVAAVLAATAADEVGDLIGTGAEVGHRVGETLGAAPDALAQSGKRLRKKWRRLTNRIVMVVALAAGYVVGSAAGRERYEQIKRAAEKAAAGARSASHQ